ncbi:hypothetical protein DFW101_0745 [Solidesulfovibrio carbinoliphilus subsp. oakridgensis]|uniref:Lipoprotein n=2 Tax=Desulfovibrionaceae TaxID=194924 RepID=G7Q3X2_9BACT|nr:hypothetical protein [Solidesulfovibrio carbinoliphilus]EHJ46762.1 hypothetical protein DFW101_0745 [Solidesulfovibrio carbinoliphilus subsp. oakridgensis]
MRAAFLVLVLLALAGASLGGCARHTYYVELNDGKYFYADPPLVLDTKKGVYRMWIAGSRQAIPMDDVRYIDDAAQICYQNGVTDTFTCFDALYQF